MLARFWIIEKLLLPANLQENMANDLKQVKTKRMNGLQLDSSHLEYFLKMHSDESLMKTLGGLRDRKTTIKYLEDNVQHWEEHGFGLWVFFDSKTNEFVGRGGLRRVKIDEQDEIEVGYALLPGFWGKGLATEIAELSIKIAFNQLGIRDLVAFTLPDNYPSRRVMEKTGFVFEKNIIYKEMSLVLYRLYSNSAKVR